MVTRLGNRTANISRYEPIEVNRPVKEHGQDVFQNSS